MPSNRPESSLFVALTADVDADANRAVPGRTEAISAGRDGAAYDACLAGLEVVLAELERRRLPATLFWEGRAAEALAESGDDLLARVRQSGLLEHACHGHAHEDFAGAGSGLRLDADRTRSALERATNVVTDIFGVRPRGFRAPYCRLTPELAAALSEQGYAYDASLTEEPSTGRRTRPRDLDGAPGVRELPLCRTRDARGRPISGYLWQLLEGNRQAGDYLEMIESFRADHPGGLLQIALHPWHLIVSAEGRPLPAGAAGRWGEFLDGAAAMPDVSFVTLADYLDLAALDG